MRRYKCEDAALWGMMRTGVWKDGKNETDERKEDKQNKEPVWMDDAPDNGMHDLDNRYEYRYLPVL